MRALKASIQTAATKVTNMLYLASGVRLLRSLTNQNFRARIYLKELDKAVCKISKLLYNK